VSVFVVFRQAHAGQHLCQQVQHVEKWITSERLRAGELPAQQRGCKDGHCAQTYARYSALARAATYTTATDIVRNSTL